MKIKWGALVVDGRGKIGGQVASKNGSGAYMRNKVTPSNPQTVAQTSARALFGAISQQWSGLTDTVRAGWSDGVVSWSKTNIFGDSVKPTGKNLFQQLNNQAQSAGYPAIGVLPAKLEMVKGIVTSASFNLTDGQIYLNGAYTGADARIVVSGTPILTKGTTFVKNKLRIFYKTVANSASEFDMYEDYESKFGTPLEGDNVYIGIKYVLPNGQVSPLQVVKMEIVS